jgi:tetratricopeptide (TPR) repeat protein
MPKNSTGHYNMLLSYSKLPDKALLKEKAETALTVLEKSLITRAEDKYFSYVHVYFILWSGRLAEAKRSLERMLEDKSLDSMTLYNLGCIYEDLGEGERYIKVTAEAIERGFRAIEGPKSMHFSDPILQEKLDSLILDLEALIEEESKK